MSAGRVRVAAPGANRSRTAMPAAITAPPRPARDALLTPRPPCLEEQMMSRTTALRAFMVGAPLAFAALLTRHPMGGGDLFTEVSADVGSWLAVHYGSSILFPAMALIVWLLLRDTRGRGATIARCALPVFAVFYVVWEAIFGIANGLLAQTGNTLSGDAR